MFYENNIPFTTIRVLLIVVGTLGMMCSTAKFRYHPKRVLVILFLYLCYAVCYTATVINLFDYLIFMRTVLPTISAPAIYLIFRLADDQLPKSIFNYTTQLLCSLYLAGSMTLIATHTHISKLTYCIALALIYGIVILGEYRFLRRPFLRLFSIAEKGWLILALIPCSLMVLVMTLAAYPVHFTKSSTAVLFIYLLGFVIVIIYFAIFQFLLTQYRFQTARQDLEILKIQNENLKEKMERDAAATERSLIDRHDTRHRFQTIASLLESGQIGRAMDYVLQSANRIEMETSTIYCKDVLLNATLSSYFGQAKKEGITLETHLSLPDMLPIDSGEFSIVIANALENAIHACRLLPEAEKKIIFQCIYKPKLMLQISNPCKQEILFSESGLPLSGEKEHGFGTRSIIAFCKKYGALCSFSVDEGWFRLKIVL